MIFMFLTLGFLPCNFLLRACLHDNPFSGLSSMRHVISTARVVSTVCNKIHASHRYLTLYHRHPFLRCFWLSFAISSPHYHIHLSTIVLHFLYLSYTTPSGISDELFCQAFSFDKLFCQASRSSCFLLWASFHATSYSGLAYMTILSPGFLP